MTTATRNAFIYGMTESIGETAIAYSLTAARWGVLAYDLVTSEEARQTYRWVKGMTIALGQLAFWSVVWAYAKTCQWAEAEVQSCLATEISEAPTAPQPETISEAPQPMAQPAMSQAIAAPAAVAVVKVAPAQPRQYSIRELKQMASEAKVKGYGNMTKARLMEVLALA